MELDLLFAFENNSSHIQLQMQMPILWWSHINPKRRGPPVWGMGSRYSALKRVNSFTTLNFCTPILPNLQLPFILSFHFYIPISNLFYQVGCEFFVVVGAFFMSIQKDLLYSLSTLTLQSFLFLSLYIDMIICRILDLYINYNQ